MGIEFLRPKTKRRIMDLVDATGIDVSDWENFQGGKIRAASNPKYCYEWSFEDVNKKIFVFNLWFDLIKELPNQEFIQQLNQRKVSEEVSSPAQVRRALKMDSSLYKAAQMNAPIRAIICDGSRRSANAKKSSADRRLLDSEPWYIKSYNPETGECYLIRGKGSETFIDQFELENLPQGDLGRKEITVNSRNRSPQVRKYVLARAKGSCELCGKQGFKTASGSIYLETHHVLPLADNGEDHPSNVVALCPNDHKKAHFSENADKIKAELINILKHLI